MQYVRSAVVALALSPLSATALAGIVWNESVQGDLSGNPASPTPIALDLGSNEIIGSVFASADTRDYFTFSIPTGRSLAGIFLISYTDLTTGGDGNTAYILIDDGATSVIPSGANSSTFLGGTHLDRSVAPNTTTNLLDILAAAPAGGIGFVAPLGPGQYTIDVQQTGPQRTGYRLDLVVVPAPATIAGFAALGLITARRRR